MTSSVYSVIRKTRFLWTGVAAGLALAIAVVGSPASAQSDLSEDQVKRKVESAYGVTVLRVEKISNRGPAFFAVTAMNGPGDFSDAFQVNTVAVDPKTGDLIRQYRHTSSGMRFAAPSVDVRTSPRLGNTP